MTSPDFTPAQWRVLRLLAAYPGWWALRDLDRIAMLDADTATSVPPLIERGLVDLLRAVKAVRITDAGAAAAAGMAP